jgi:predicted  nucleic acid-binding Zn ribbon protein
MTIGTWEPAKSSSLTVERLQELLTQISSLEENALTASLNDDFIRSNSQLMKLDAISWQVAEQLAEDDLVALIRFFTLAEMQLSGWEAGNRSPVIPLVKILKQRNQFSQELRKWIKTSTDNRYLPYGSAL